MALFTIPVSDTTDPFEEQVELDGLIYDLAFTWNPRDNHWFLTVGREGVTLLTHVKVVNDQDLLAPYTRTEDLPPGSLQVVDLDDEDKDPCATDFGDRVVLRYEEADA